MHLKKCYCILYMNTEELIDSTITNLKIISAVQKNGRLCIRKGQLTLERDDHFQIIRRWVNKDSRELTLMHIKNTINNAIKLSKGLIQNLIQTDLRQWTIEKLIEEMQNCQGGLLNLKTTYNDDYSFKATLDVLGERLEANCEELQDFNKIMLQTQQPQVPPQQQPQQQHQPNQTSKAK